MIPKIYLNHIGFLIDSRKRVIVEDSSAERFEIQDMAISTSESLGEFENWKTIFTGSLERQITDMGTFLVGDFSELTIPGIYRAIIPGFDSPSYIFQVSDGAYALAPHLFFDFVHLWRSGDFDHPYRGKTHLDDGIRADNGKEHILRGGWYDAGDLRKWMTHSNLPVLGFLDFAKRKEFAGTSLIKDDFSENDWITESAWAIRFILSMQDPETGMFFEEIGGGGEARRQAHMTWWYENHSGCYADNSQNYFTDNIKGSGDERKIRTSYNPLIQYISIAILCKFAQAIVSDKPDLAERCLDSANRAYEFVEKVRNTDPLHQWTSVRAWRLSSQMSLFAFKLCQKEDLFRSFEELTECFIDELGFFSMGKNDSTPYRGIIHSAQPVLALCEWLVLFPSSLASDKCRTLLNWILEQYVLPLTKTNPFGIIPYGLYTGKETKGDLFRNWKNGYYYRFFMPEHAEQKINHGLAGHWTQWAHALSFCAQVLSRPELKDIAWDQLYWLFGGNPLEVCMVSGMGYNNPMPHSRFFGAVPGGFMGGPRGNADDEIRVDLNRRAEWNSTEYWNYPLANTLQAFHKLFPVLFEEEKKLGRSRSGKSYSDIIT